MKKYVIERDYRTFGSTNVAIGYKIPNISQDLTQKDTVILRLTKTATDTLGESWTQTAVFGRDAASNFSTLRLVSGKYEVDAQLLDYNGITIPKECKEICVEEYPIIGCVKHKKLPPDPISLDVAPWGGIKFTGNNQVILTTENLLSNNTLEFYIVRMPDPRCLDDMNEPQMTGYFANKYRNILSPKFV